MVVRKDILVSEVDYSSWIRSKYSSFQNKSPRTFYTNSNVILDEFQIILYLFF